MIGAELENLGALQDFVGARLEDCPLEIRNQIGIVVDEVFSNISRYAYSRPAGGVAVRIAVDGNITIEFEDSGVAFNPLDRNEPDVSLPAEEREFGGLGIFIVRNIMDLIEYRREGNKNILTMLKENRYVISESA